MLIDSGFVTSSFRVSGSYAQTGNAVITGSLNVTAGITGSLFGTSSHAVTASFFGGSISSATSASYASSSTSASYAINAGNAQSASFTTNANSASYALNAGNTQTASFATNAATAFIQNGNSFGAAALLGTNDSQSLQFETSGSIRMTISGSGPIGIGTTTPTLALLQVQGNVSASSYSGSLLGTASFATNAISSSFPITVTGSTLRSVSPEAGVGANINTSIFLGLDAGGQATNASNSIFLGWYAGASASNSSNSNFLGTDAGSLATEANQSNFLGREAGILAINASSSNFFGNRAGYQAFKANHSNFLGKDAGMSAISASYSTLIGYQVGRNVVGLEGTSIKSNNIIIGTNITLPNGTQNSINLGAIIFATGSYSTITGTPFSGSANGRVGINVINPTNTLEVAGNVSASAFTGSLLGTASFATNANSSSYALNAGTTISSSFSTNAGSASYATNAGTTISSSFSTNAGSASYATNAGNAQSSSFASTASSADNFTVRNTLTATTIVVQTITSSVNFVTGSTRFGILASNTHVFTGSVSISGSLTVQGAISGSNITGSLLGTASYANNALSSSYAVNAGNAISASFSTNVGSASYALNAGNTQTASFATNANSASYALNAGNAQTASFATNVANAFIQNGNSFGAAALLGTNDAQNLQFETNGTVRMTISSSGDIGIGTTVTDARLRVAGTINATHSIFGNTDGRGLAIQTVLVAGTNEAGSILNARGVGAGTLIFQTDNTERVRIAADGKVGIGTTSPSSLLDVRGQTTIISNAATLQLSGSDHTYIELYPSNSIGRQAYIGFPAAGSKDLQIVNESTTGNLNLFTNNSTRVTILTNGNVGISTTSPAYKLDVSGTLRTTGNVLASNVINLIGTENSSAKIKAGKFLSIADDGFTVGINYNSDSIPFGGFITMISGSTYNSGNIVANGNIGVGITAPTYNLHVSSSSSPTIMVQSANNIGGQFRAKNTTGEYVKGIEGNTSGGWMDYDIINSQYITLYRTGSAGYYAIYTNGGERITVSGSGNVGIGQTSPASKLDVNGIIFAGSNSATEGTLILQDQYSSGHLTNFGTNRSSGGPVIGYGVYPSAGATNAFSSSVHSTITIARSAFSMDSEFRWYTGGSQTVSIGAAATLSQRMVLDNNGNLGIGATSPGARFEIKSSAANNLGGLLLRATSTANFPALLYENSTNGGALDLYNNATLVSRIAANGDSYVSSSGNFGVGTTTPTEKLHVVGGNIKVNNAYAMYFGDSANNNGGRIYCASATNDFYINQVNNSPLYLATNNNVRLTILGGGDVGIGTTSPYDKLEVLGAIAATGASTGTSAQGTATIISVESGVGYLRAVDWGAEYKSLVVEGQTISLQTGVGSTTPRVIITSGGNVGINTTPSYRLDVSGSARITGSLAVGNIAPSATAGRIDASNDVVAFSTSDARFKTNITPISNALNKITQIGGYEFDWIPNQEYHGFEGHDVGVIAQEIEKVLPEVVKERDNGYKAVKYEKIVPLLIEAIKEQQKQIDELKYLLQSK